MANKEFDLGNVIGPQGPQGEPGKDGAPGATGAAGKSIFAATVEITANSDVANTSLVNGDTVAVGDLIVDNNGNVFSVASITDSAAHVGDVVFSIRGPKGDSGAAGTTDASGVSYNDSNVAATLDKVLSDIADIQYTPINITSFSSSVTTAEKGSTVNSVTLNWNYNKTPKTLTLDSESVDVSTKSKTIDNANLTANKTWTLAATDERDAKSSKTASLTFLNGAYYGVGNADGAAIDNAFVAGLQKVLTSSRARDFTVNAGAGEYIYYAIPATFGTPVFYVGGFEGGFNLAKTFDYQNPSGFTESYNVYKSTNANLGNTTVTVK